MAYQSSVRYDPNRIGAAALYCSDGRVGEAFDDFLQNGLDLPRYDRICVPGGPAFLAGRPHASMISDAAVDEMNMLEGFVDELNFLVQAHELNRIILIAHQGCAYYSKQLQLEEPFLEMEQWNDLAKAAAFVRNVTGLGEVQCFFARLTAKGWFVFEGVQV